MMAKRESAVDEAVLHMTGMDAKTIGETLNDRITRAFLLEPGMERELALDFNARLVTELRSAKMWPAKRAHPCEIDE